MVATEHTNASAVNGRRAAAHDGVEGGPGSIAQLVEHATALEVRAPELALVLGERAAALAESAGDNELWVRAESLVVHARVRLGHRASTVGRAVAALRAAEDARHPVTAAQLRTDLAVCARSVGAPLTGLAALRPVLTVNGLSSVQRATALCHLVGCLGTFGRKVELDRVLMEGDRLISVDGRLPGDDKQVARALLRVGVSAHRRRHGDLVGAADAARTGLGFLDDLRDTGADGGLARVRLTLELVCALLDRGDVGPALEVAEPALAGPERAASVAPLGWLRLAVATRVHLVDGSAEAAARTLREAVHSTGRHGLYALASRLWLELAHLEERIGEATEAAQCLYRARAAEHLNTRVSGQARALLTGAFGAGEQAPVDLAEVVAAAAQATTAQGAQAGAQATARAAQEHARQRDAGGPSASPGAPEGDGTRGGAPQAPRGRNQAEQTPAARNPAEVEPERRVPGQQTPARRGPNRHQGAQEAPGGGRHSGTGSDRQDMPGPARAGGRAAASADGGGARPRVVLPMLRSGPADGADGGGDGQATGPEQAGPAGENRPAPPAGSAAEATTVTPAVPAPGGDTAAPSGGRRRKPETPEPRPGDGVRPDEVPDPGSDPPYWDTDRPPFTTAAGTRHDSESGSVAARSVLDRLGISPGASGGRRRAADGDGAPDGIPGGTPGNPDGDRDAAAEPAPAGGGDRAPGSGDEPPRQRPAPDTVPSAEETWLPRLKLPPSLAPVDNVERFVDDAAGRDDPHTAGDGAGNTAPSGGTGERGGSDRADFTGDPAATVTLSAVPPDGPPPGEAPRSRAEDTGAEAPRDDPPADAGLAELLARALAEHQAGTSSASALVKQLGVDDDRDHHSRVNGRHRGEG